MNRRLIIAGLAVASLLGIGTLLVLLRPRPAPGMGGAELAGAEAAATAMDSGGGSQPHRVVDTRAASGRVAVDPGNPSSLLELPEMALAVDSFRFIDSLKDSFPAVSNGRKRLEVLQQKLFRDDLAFAGSLDERIPCDRASMLMESLSQSGGDVGLPPAGSARPSSPSPALGRSGTLARLHESLISDGNQPGFSAIAGLLAPWLDQSAAGSGVFQDACLYAGLRTYLDEVLSQHERESAVMARRLKDQFAVEHPEVPANFVKSSEAEAHEYRRVLESYRAIFARRMERWLGAAGAEVIVQLDQVKLPRVGSELSVPCTSR